MLGTTGATIITIAYFIFAGVLGVAAGGLSCLVLHRRWRFKSAAIDAAAAMLVLLVAGFIEIKIDTARGTWGSYDTLNFIIAAAIAAIRHFATSA